jgi:hypothetical protein
VRTDLVSNLNPVPFWKGVAVVSFHCNGITAKINLTSQNHTTSSSMTSALFGRVTEQKTGGPTTPLVTSMPLSFVKKNDISGEAVSEPLKVVNWWMVKG